MTTVIVAISLAGSAALSLAGCASIEQMAPLVEGPVAAEASAQGVALDTLNRGRQIYLNQCVRCHTVEPIDRYTWRHWEKLLPEMNEEAKLTAAQSSDLHAYLFAAHRVMKK